MSATESDDDLVDASYSARKALDEAQDYAELAADYAQMQYMFEGGEAEEAFLQELVEDDSFGRWDESYDPETIEGWIADPEQSRAAVELYEEAVEDYLEERKQDLRNALQQAKVAKNAAKSSGELERSEHRHYGANDIDPASVEHEIELADKLVETVDKYVADAFNDSVRRRSPRGPAAR